MSKSLKAGKPQNDFRKDGADEPELKRKMAPFSKKDRIQILANADWWSYWFNQQPIKGN